MARERSIEFSAIQRIGLENLLGEQKGKREDLRVWYNIRNKIRLGSEERKQLLHPGPNGNGQFFDETAAARMTPLKVPLSDDEIRRLIKLGDSVELATGMLDWFEPLLQELEQKQPVEAKPS